MTLDYTPNDPWTWRVADARDIEDIVLLCEQHFKSEMSDFFTPDKAYYRYQIDLAVTNQRHNYAKELLIVAGCKESNKLLAYGWLDRGSVPYSQDALAEAKMAHIDLTLSARTRIKLLTQMITHWISWCNAVDIPVLLSTTIRADQTVFMRIHERLGFTVRGSYAYKRLQRE